MEYAPKLLKQQEISRFEPETPLAIGKAAFTEAREKSIERIKSKQLERNKTDLIYVQGELAKLYPKEAKGVALNKKATSLLFTKKAGGSRQFWNRYFVPNMERARSPNKRTEAPKVRSIVKSFLDELKSAATKLHKDVGLINRAERVATHKVWKDCYTMLITPAK